MPFKSGTDSPSGGDGAATPGGAAPCPVTCTLAMTSETIATSPADRTRTKIGVGEEVRIITTGAQGSVKWTITGSSKLSSKSGPTVRLTAHDRAETTTVTATDSKGCTASLTFTIVEPTDWTMKAGAVRHQNGRPDCGFKGKFFIHPNDVNFYRVQIREKDSTATATGSFAVFNGVKHGNYPAPDFASAFLSMRTHTDADGSEVAAVDNVYSGDPGSAATGTAVPFTVGDMSFPITLQWKVIGGTTTPPEKNFPVTNQEHHITSDGRCRSSKGGDSRTRLFSDPTETN